MGRLTDHILHLHGWAALAVVFLLPALESSAFVGFLFPGELAVLLGGVLAYQHRISLPAAIAAGVLGAVIGDTIGYEVGKHVGRRLLDGTIGRFVNHSHLDKAEHYLAERGGKAVFLGRFTAALRVLIPGMAGMSGMPYRTFASYNITGGALWATGFVLAGYAGGSSYHQVESVAKKASLLLLLLIVLIVVVVWGARRVVREQARVRAWAARELDRPWIVAIRGRYRRQIDFLLGRLRPSGTLGLSLTASLVVIGLVGWAFGAVMQNVLTSESLDAVDKPLLRFLVAHREHWLTTVAKAGNALGSPTVLLPVIVVVGWWAMFRTRTPRPFVLLAVGYVGAEALTRFIKLLVDRPRPPASLAVHPFSGAAFPASTAVLAVAVWGMAAALIAVAVQSWRAKVVVWTAAGAFAVFAGMTALYLGGSWFTDVVGGWALGALWLFALLLAVRTVAVLRHTTRVRSAR